MNDVSVIDRFLDTFSTYIDSGFGLVHGDVAFLTATLVAIDMTLAGLYWALGHATGQGDDVMAKLIRKVLFVGAFAYILNNWNWLTGIVFNSFAGLGLKASGAALNPATFLQPGRIAKTGIDAAAPLLDQIAEMAGFPEVFVNMTPISVMFLAWLVIVLSFFVLAIQLFVTLIEFKLTTLAGFVLIPFALWNKTAFLAEKTLGNVVSSGVKVLVLAVIVGIGSGLFAEFKIAPDDSAIDHSLVVMLASLALLALGIFGPGIATGLVSGAPQLGAGAAAGTVLGVAGTAVVIGAGVAGVNRFLGGGAKMASTAAGAASGGMRPGASPSPDTPSGTPPGGGNAGGSNPAAASGATAEQAPPVWAERLHQSQRAAHVVAHTLRRGDGGGAGSGPDLNDPDK